MCFHSLFPLVFIADNNTSMDFLYMNAKAQLNTSANMIARLVLFKATVRHTTKNISINADDNKNSLLKTMSFILIRTIAQTRSEII